MAQYRCGLMAEAVATLTRSNDLNTEQQPADLAFLALAQNRLGQSENARDTLARLRKMMRPPRGPGSGGAGLSREAETIELEELFSTVPFAP